MLTADFDWKKIAEPVMRLYMEATDGSCIEHKESALVWHHQEADPDFGSCQAKELLDHLENVLANEPVVVKRGQHIVEVNPQVRTGVSVYTFTTFSELFGFNSDKRNGLYLISMVDHDPMSVSFKLKVH